VLLENQHQGRLVASQRVVATCRLPLYFKVGKRQAGQGAPAATAGGTVPPQNVAGSPSGQHPMTCDTPTPRPCARAELSVPTLEPMILSSPGSSSFSEGEHQAVSLVPKSNIQAPVAHGPGANRVAGPTQRKRGRAEAELDDEDSRGTTGERRVRPRLEQLNHAPSTGSAAGSSAPPASHPLSQPFNTAAGPGVTQIITPRGVPSPNGSSNSPATSATPSASQLDPSLRPVQGHQHSAQPVESCTMILEAVNPRSGPVCGGIDIWLAGQEFPTTFTLYARFGTRVVPTVSSMLPPLPQSSSNIRIRRFRIRRRWHVYFPLRVIPAV